MSCLDVVLRDQVTLYWIEKQRGRESSRFVGDRVDVWCVCDLKYQLSPIVHCPLLRTRFVQK